MKTHQEVKIQMGIDRAKAVFEKRLLPMLIEQYKTGHTDFRLAMQSDNSFLVHPLGKDGITVDINWQPYQGTFANEHDTPSGEDLDLTGYI